jgi:predicted nucleotidyltransferase
MNPENSSYEELFERGKELRCLYAIDDILKDHSVSLETILNKVITTLPSGWQYSKFCVARIIHGLTEVKSADFRRTQWQQTAPLIVDKKHVGSIEVYYTKNLSGKENPFLYEEQKLLDTIANHLSTHIFHRRVFHTFKEMQEAQNILAHLQDNHADLVATLQNIDIEKFNQYLESSAHSISSTEEIEKLPVQSDKHWRWRMSVAKAIKRYLDHEKYCVNEVYIFGSTKNATAGPASDIDLIIHFQGTDKQKDDLLLWLEGWSYCLGEINYQRTGKRVDKLLDVHLVTDEDIRNKTSFAVKIDAIDDGARALKGELE